MSPPPRKDLQQPPTAPPTPPPYAPPPQAPPPMGYPPQQPQPPGYGYPPQQQPAPGYGYPPPVQPGLVNYGQQPYYPQAPQPAPAGYPPAPGYPPPPMGAPAPYGYAPAPMYAPAYGMPPIMPFAPANPGHGTLEGLERMEQMTFAAIAASMVTLFIGLVAVGHYASGNMSSTFFDSAGFPLHIISLIAQFIAVGLGWMAIDDIKDSAAEINPEHQASTKKAMNFVYFAAIIWFVGGVGGAATSFGSLFSGFGGGAAQAINTMAIIFQAIFGATGFVVNLLVAMALQNSLAKIMKQPGRSKTMMFYILALGGTAASFGLSMVSLVVLGGANLAPLASILSVLSFWVLRMQAKSAAEGTRVLAVTHGTDPDAAMSTASPAPA